MKLACSTFIACVYLHVAESLREAEKYIFALTKFLHFPLTISPVRKRVKTSKGLGVGHEISFVSVSDDNAISVFTL